MDYVGTLEKIVKALVVDKEAVRVKEFQEDDENAILLEVMVQEDDLGRVIGKNGKTASAIRTLKQVVHFTITNMSKSILINFKRGKSFFFYRKNFEIFLVLLVKILKFIIIEKYKRREEI